MYLAWGVCLFSMISSLILSDYLNLPPCPLCWYQRVFMYSLVFVIPTGLFLRDAKLKVYVLVLAAVGGLISLYHNLIYFGLIEEGLKLCSAALSCKSKQFEMFGFLGIPMLSLLAFVLVLILNKYSKTHIPKESKSFSNKKNKSEMNQNVFVKFADEIKSLSLVSVVVFVTSILFYFYADDLKEAKATTDQIQANKVFETGSIESFSYGPASAKVTVVEFFDPECETCAMVSPYIKNEMKYYEGKVRWIFRYMAFHPNSRNAIAVLEAARKQGKYLEAMSLLFERQKEWGATHDGSEKNESKLKQLIEIVSSIEGIDSKKLKEDVNDPRIDQLIESDKSEGTLARVTGTPTLFVNGKMIEPLSLDKMIELIDAGLK